MSVDPRGGPKIGVLTPYTNTNLEPDMALMAPEGCTMHFERLGDYDIEATPDAEQMKRLGASDLAESLRLIAGVRPTAVLYGCTSATLTHGAAFDRDLAREIETRCGAQCVTAAGALIDALRALGATKIGFASPYVGAINDQAEAFFESWGVGVARRSEIGVALGNYGQGELTPDDAFALGRAADGPEIEAIVLSCTDLRAVEAIARLEEATGKPVVTSNQALIFALCAMLALRRPRSAPGRLFERLR